MEILSKSDIAERWGISRQLVQNRTVRDEDFPTPIQYVSKGTIPIYTLESIKLYEEKKGISVTEASK